MLNHEYWFDKRKNLRIYVFLFSIFLLILMIPTVYAFLWVESINVEPQGRESLTFNMTYGKIFDGRIWSINGTYDDSINFWVTNPNGDTILNLGRLTNRDTKFEFSSLQDGVYTLHFDNSFSSSPKTVEYSYDITKDYLMPAYFVALGMWLILPPLVKHILGYRWLTTYAVSIGTIGLVMVHLFCLLYMTRPIII